MPTTGDRGNTMHSNAIALSPKAPWQHSMSPSSIPAEVDTFCQQHGLTEPFLQEGHWWAFPRGQAMPIPLTTSDDSPTQRQLLHLQAELVVTHVALEQAQRLLQQQAETILYQSFQPRIDSHHRNRVRSASGSLKPLDQQSLGITSPPYT